MLHRIMTRLLDVPGLSAILLGLGAVGTGFATLVLTSAVFKTFDPPIGMIILAALAGPLGVAAWMAVPRALAGEYLRRGRTLAEDGESLDALPYLSKAVNLNPLYGDAYAVRSEVYRTLGEMDLAMEDAELAVRYTPQHVSGRLVRARLYVHFNLVDEAIRDLKYAIRLQPDFVLTYLELAQLHVKLGDYQDSLDVLRSLEHVGRSDPLYYDSLILRGRVYEDHMHDLDLAIASYSQAIPVSPERKAGYLRRAQAYNSRGDFRQAAEDLLRAAERRRLPEDGDFYHWLRASCYMRRYTITQDTTDMQAWLGALERSVREDGPGFRDESRRTLETLRRAEAETAPISRAALPNARMQFPPKKPTIYLN